ncbi:hypothetical protein J6590_103873 [Homalodisca vitripennis]|nr:hypothetical protein J6590_103873 [Homalodisca vitripennis]
MNDQSTRTARTPRASGGVEATRRQMMTRTVLRTRCAQRQMGPVVVMYSDTQITQWGGAPRPRSATSLIEVPDSISSVKHHRSDGCVTIKPE